MNNNEILSNIINTDTKKTISLNLKQSTIDRLNKFKDSQVSKGYKKPKNSELIEELLNQFLDSMNKFEETKFEVTK